MFEKETWLIYATATPKAYGPDAISFQIAQVGEDQKAQAFLGELDNHPEVGELVDVTSSYELESAEMLAKSGQELTPELWLVKLVSPILPLKARESSMTWSAYFSSLEVLTTATM